MAQASLPVMTRLGSPGVNSMNRGSSGENSRM
jgi:hypothetical protein